MAEGNGFTTQRRSDDVRPSALRSLTGLYVGAIVVLSVVGMLSVLALLIFRPTSADNTRDIAAILGFLFSVVSPLLALVIREVKLTVDGRMSEMMVLVGRTAAAEAAVREKDQTLKLALAMPPETAATLDESTPPPPPTTTPPPRRP